MKIFVSNALSLITSQQLHASSMIAIYLVDIKTDRIFYKSKVMMCMEKKITCITHVHTSQHYYTFFKGPVKS